MGAGATASGRDFSGVVQNGNGLSAGGSATSSSSSGGGGSGGGGSSSGISGGWSTTIKQRRTPNKVYTAAADAVAYTVRTQAPAGASVVKPPPSEAAAARVRPNQVTAALAAVVAASKAKATGTWQAAGAIVSGDPAGQWRDVYMSQAYYDPRYAMWSINFDCRFRADWNVRNTVTLLATVVKSGVISYGSAASEADAPLGLAYPQVAVRGGTMLVTYTYSSSANMPAVPGVRFADVPAYAGEGKGGDEGVSWSMPQAPPSSPFTCEFLLS
jgi:hypothetical protein